MSSICISSCWAVNGSKPIRSCLFVCNDYELSDYQHDNDDSIQFNDDPPPNNENADSDPDNLNNKIKTENENENGIQPLISGKLFPSDKIEKKNNDIFDLLQSCDNCIQLNQPKEDNHSPCRIFIYQDLNLNERKQEKDEWKYENENNDNGNQNGNDDHHDNKEKELTQPGTTPLTLLPSKSTCNLISGFSMLTSARVIQVHIGDFDEYSVSLNGELIDDSDNEMIMYRFDHDFKSPINKFSLTLVNPNNKNRNFNNNNCNSKSNFNQNKTQIWLYALQINIKQTKTRAQTSKMTQYNISKTGGSELNTKSKVNDKKYLEGKSFANFNPFSQNNPIGLMSFMSLASIFTKSNNLPVGQLETLIQMHSANSAANSVQSIQHNDIDDSNDKNRNVENKQFDTQIQPKTSVFQLSTVENVANTRGFHQNDNDECNFKNHKTLLSETADEANVNVSVNVESNGKNFYKTHQKTNDDDSSERVGKLVNETVGLKRVKKITGNKTSLEISSVDGINLIDSSESSSLSLPSSSGTKWENNCHYTNINNSNNYNNSCCCCRCNCQNIHLMISKQIDAKFNELEKNFALKLAQIENKFDKIFHLMNSNPTSNSITN